MILTRELPQNRYLAAVANPMLRTTAGDVLKASLSGPTLGGLVRRAFGLTDAETDVVWDEQRQDIVTVPRTDTVAADVLNERYKDLDIGFDRPMTEDAARIIADAKRAEMIRQDIIARGPGGVAGFGAAMAGGLAAMATDPLEIATALIPVVGPASRAILVGRLGRFGGRVAEGVVEGAVGNAITEPFYYGLSRSQKLDYDMGDALLNVGLGAAFGGILGTGAAIVGRRAGRALEAPPALDVSASRIDADLTPVARMAALRTSVAQMAQGQDVDIPAQARRPVTVLEALQSVGVRDDGGDLASVGVGNWDRDQHFQRNVIRADGATQDMAARALWERGYFRDEPEAQAMLAAERGEGPEPDLVAAMHRAIDAELRGEPRFAAEDEIAAAEWRAGQAGAALRERRQEVRRAVGDLPDSRIDAIIDLMDRFGFSLEDARARAAVSADPVRVAERELRAASEDEGWAREVDEALDEQFDIFAEEDGMLDGRIADLRLRGLIGDETEAEIAAAGEIVAKAQAAGEVARAAAACLISVPF